MTYRRRSGDKFLELAAVAKEETYDKRLLPSLLIPLGRWEIQDSAQRL